MLLTVRDIDPTDVPSMFCTDPDLAAEVAAVNRSIQRLDESVATWMYLDPQETLAGKEVIA